MAGGVIYLDVDDEITSAAARIRDVEGRRVGGRAAVRLAGGDVAHQLPAAGPRRADPREAPLDRRRRRGDAGAGGVGRPAGLRLGRRSTRTRSGRAPMPRRRAPRRPQRPPRPRERPRRLRRGRGGRGCSPGRRHGPDADRRPPAPAPDVPVQQTARRHGGGRACRGGSRAPDDIRAHPAPDGRCRRHVRPRRSPQGPRSAPARREPPWRDPRVQDEPVRGGPVTRGSTRTRRRGPRWRSRSRRSRWRCSSAGSAPTCSCRRPRSP